MIVKLFTHLKKMGAKKIELDFTFDEGIHYNKGTIDGHKSPILDSIATELLETIDDQISDEIDNAELSNCSDTEESRYVNAKMEIDLNTDEVECSCDIQYTASGMPRIETLKTGIPEEFQDTELPESFIITYSGSGDSGGIDDVTYNGNTSEQFKEYIDNIKDNLVPGDANFNNEGSFGQIECKIKKRNMIQTFTHTENYYETVNMSPTVNLDDIDIELEI